MARGYAWLDISLVAEENVMSNRLIRNMGAQVYKVFRTYQMPL